MSSQLMRFFYSNKKERLETDENGRVCNGNIIYIKVY